MSHLALVYESKYPNARQTVKWRPIPEPESNQIQVKVHATAVNPVDYKEFDNGWFVTTVPTILGMDASGEVTKVGSNVTKFSVGDRVLFNGQWNCQGDGSNGNKATFQQIALVDADLTAKMPDTLDYDSAATIPMAMDTAASALYDLGLSLTPPWEGGEGKYSGQTFVVLGGSSSVGAYTIQLAVLSGFRVITTASIVHADYLKSIGASTVIDRKSSTVASDVLAAVGGEPRYVLDAISLADTQQEAMDIVAPGGTVILVLGVQPRAMGMALEKNVRLRGCHGAPHRYPEFFRGFWAAVGGYLERGVIKANKPRVLPGGLHAWEEAFALHREGKLSGEKVVMRPWETKEISPRDEL
ncbi:GroES-like protein [Heliocybe sulcata]|uniref:GroES-like protein n=1 Tax=Heliocybe sulcata TaxID=5364 RepID=A0A5C3MY55_9AGAM|nr:GroES-like protein [Heliocybe sulcata]